MTRLAATCPAPTREEMLPGGHDEQVLGSESLARSHEQHNGCRRDSEAKQNGQALRVRSSAGDRDGSAPRARGDGCSDIWASAQGGQPVETMLSHPVAGPPPPPSRLNAELGCDILDLAF